jgi:Fe(II)/alpha-ketoglutarate-dependent arginine beta-hydroxylase
MNKMFLSEGEINQIGLILDHLGSLYDSVENEEFLKDACLYAHELPLRVRRFLNDFKLLESSGGIGLISGYPIDEAKIGLTPQHWKDRPPRSPALEEEILLMLFGALLGEALGWSTQQNGHIIHELFPIKAQANDQLGTGSKQTLYWHNEDAFHDYRGDYLSLVCLRNPDAVATTYASIDQVKLDQAQVNALFEPRYIIRPDESHLVKNLAAAANAGVEFDGALASSYRRIEEMNTNPAKLAILYGDRQSPYIRIDPYFMEPPQDECARAALQSLVNALEENLSCVVLQPGDFLFLDNYKVVHGRQPFKPKYNGKDRWLKRINITRNLRASRESRLSPTSRIIY